jgi:hypothetical protein
MTRNRKRNNFQNTFKDYLVPIIWWVLLLLILFSIFNKNEDTQSNTENQNTENRSPVDISFNTVDTSAFIEYPNGSKEEITESQNLYKWETIIVKDGSLNLNLTNDTQINLNKIAELKYNEEGSISLYSSDAWISLGENTEIGMKYANVSSPAGSVISLTQNEAGSSIYVLSWSARVSNLEWVSTSLIKGQKINISRQNAANKDLDLSSEKWNIDSYFKGSDWFIDNKWFEILQKDEPEEDTETETWNWESWDFLSFNSLRDEMSTSKSSLDISGSILNDKVSSITINNKQVAVNASESTFTVSNILLWKSVNDLVIKIYGSDKAILEKKVITVYSSTPASSNTSTQSTTQTTPVASSWGATFGVDATDFSFTSPSTSGKFVATGSEITIRGVTTAENISKVEVNGFKLASFNGSTWRYHAFERFETLEEWTNQYKVDYFWEDGSLVYTDYYTIVKKPAANTPVTSETEVTEKVISAEASTQ